MPKKKNVSSSESDSDSGPDDRTPAKKSKTDSSSTSTGAGVKTKDGIVFDLDKNRRVTVRDFKGKSYVDIREFYSKGDEMLPGKKGISLQPDQWRKLLGMADEINAALADM